jgi:uncharacterized protein YneF (UPF0154 family)
MCGSWAIQANQGKSRLAGMNFQMIRLKIIRPGGMPCSHHLRLLVIGLGMGIVRVMKVFYTGPLINAEMLVMMLEKHGIAASQEFVEPELPDDGDLNRLTKVLVPEAEYDRAHRLFYTEREDEL